MIEHGRDFNDADSEFACGVNDEPLDVEANFALKRGFSPFGTEPNVGTTAS